MKGGKQWEFGDNWDNSQIDVNHLLMPANIRRTIYLKTKYKLERVQLCETQI